MNDLAITYIDRDSCRRTQCIDVEGLVLNTRVNSDAIDFILLIESKGDRRTRAVKRHRRARPEISAAYFRERKRSGPLQARTRCHVRDGGLRTNRGSEPLGELLGSDLDRRSCLLRLRAEEEEPDCPDQGEKHEDERDDLHGVGATRSGRHLDSSAALDSVRVIGVIFWAEYNVRQRSSAPVAILTPGRILQVATDARFTVGIQLIVAHGAGLLGLVLGARRKLCVRLDNRRCRDYPPAREHDSVIDLGIGCNS